MPLLTCDPILHIYFLDGVEIPSVTTILKEAGLRPTYNGFTDATLRGLHVHEACEYLDLNDLDWRSVYPAWAGYVKSWERFTQETGFVSELIEYQTYHPEFRFAGTMDRRGTMPILGERRAELDLKTGIEEDWHRLQTAGYQLLGREAWAKDRRGAVYLHEDGSMPKLVWHDDPGELRVFLSGLTICHYKRSLP